MSWEMSSVDKIQLPDSNSQDEEVPAKPGSIISNESSASSFNSPQPDSKPATPDMTTPKIQTSSKGVENAKKRLRAFSIQKKVPLTPMVTMPKVAIGTGSSTVLIGKLSSAKLTHKPSPESVDEQKKLPKPPKPGSNRNSDSYNDLKKQTLVEIEDMKRKMELVELGIPLGLICPPQNSDKAMPTKAMPPIKSFLDQYNRLSDIEVEKELIHIVLRHENKISFCWKLVLEFRHLTTSLNVLYLSFYKEDNDHTPDRLSFDIFTGLPEIDPQQVDDIIREAKKAKEEGKEFKFDYQKLLPGYDNPFLKKKEEKRDKASDKQDRLSKNTHTSRSDRGSYREKELRRRDERRERRRLDSKNEERDRFRVQEKSKDKISDRQASRSVKIEAEEEMAKDIKEADVNLNDYLVCDSWSLDNEDKIEHISPLNESAKELVKEEEEKSRHKITQVSKRDKPLQMKPDTKKIPKLEKLKPVIDSFIYEIDPDDEPIDMFDKHTETQKYSQCRQPKKSSKSSNIEFNPDSEEASKDMSMDGMSEDFLESVINEINDDMCGDKGLVEYELSPDKNDDSISYGTPDKGKVKGSSSITPEVKRNYPGSQRSDISESGYRSTESGYKSTESILSVDSYRLTEVDKDLQEALMGKMTRATMNSLDTWSFVLKICQPLLFRHDRNKCYKETRVTPKLWYTENPKLCDCVKDRLVVYEELETCKMTLVDKVYGCDQIADGTPPKKLNWYPPISHCLNETSTIQFSTDWEVEDSNQIIKPATPNKLTAETGQSKDNLENEPDSLDLEYKRFMESVWPEIEPKKESGSNTPTKEEIRKKNNKRSLEEKGEKKSKKAKLNDSWNMEFAAEQDARRLKKRKEEKDKSKKRKRMSSDSDSSVSKSEGYKIKKVSKKKMSKRHKSKLAKKRKLERKYLKKLKEKQKKKAKKTKDKDDKVEIESDEDDKTEKKKLKKKKLLKLKKKDQRKKKTRSSSSSDSTSSETDSGSESESEKENKKSKKAKKKQEEERSRKRKKKDKKKRKYSTSESAQSEDLFDVNVLNNIKTEKLSEEDRQSKKLTEIQDFSPRRQPGKPIQEIISMKELQHDFVSNNIHIKQEILDSAPKVLEAVCEEVKEDNNSDLSKDSVAVENEDAFEDASLEKPEIKNDSPEFREPVDVETAKITETLPPLPEESNFSQSSSQDSACSVKETREKDESHLRPSSQNSNYNFNDVINASQSGYYTKVETNEVDLQSEYQNYDMYEQMAMEYQSGVANQVSSEPVSQVAATRRIETVVSHSGRGEIKCDWRAGDELRRAPSRPSRWGLKPGEANILLTGTPAAEQTANAEVFPIRSVLEQTTYKIQSITGHGSDSTNVYDEAYADMYAASDRLQYGDCFTAATTIMTDGSNNLSDVRTDGSNKLSHVRTDGPSNVRIEGPKDTKSALKEVKTDGMSARDARMDRIKNIGSDRLSEALIDGAAEKPPENRKSLDDRIDRVLRETALKEAAKVEANEAVSKEKSILVTKPGRANKRVSFADGYKPGQDSDTEEPPLKKRRRSRRLGCAWPCPASHPDHVPLWDALPPPPPPPGDPPHHQDPSIPMPMLLPSEPPPGMMPIPGMMLSTS